jgi:hypothetical protein
MQSATLEEETMSATTEVTGAVQDQMLETIELGQKAVLEGVRTWTETVEKLIPEAPSASWSKELPSLEETVDSAFDFASKVIDSQRRFAKEMIVATQPVARQANRTASVAGRQASEATAKQAPAKR